MVCIYCSHETSVVNSRPQKRLNQVWRRRHCKHCGNTFTTQESPTYEAGGFAYRTKDGTMIPLERDTLFLSIYASCSHRSTAQSDATALTGTILARLQSMHQHGVIERSAIIALAHEVLARFDTAAAVHYQAHHPI